MDAKEAAARRAVAYVQDGMTIGIGSGSTATFAIRAIGERVQNEGLKVRGVPTSSKSRSLAEAMSIPEFELSESLPIDLTIDGADEVDPSLHLIKGGGGALLREKLVASASKALLVICDESKLKPTLGAFPLPVAVVPFGWETTRRRLQRFGDTITLRRVSENGDPFVSDDGLFILDLHLGKILDAAALEDNIKRTVGVVEVGLFVGLTSRVIVGYADGRTEERTP
ncbi:MAG TPA: ribose-5-phosphate isomerase RpiA [Chthonomonadaceae bacterium]|nr:ribose-5-phosphate isomerase RpiA [Chthonomonadaceae bacterium]